MKKVCPPGVFCIENTTLSFLFIIVLLSLAVLYYAAYYHKHIIIQPNNQTNLPQHPSNVFLNPHHPPLKTNMYLHPNPVNHDRGLPINDVRGIPINIKTQSNNHDYSQIGVLNRINGKETILPLMGKILISNRSKWQYYTISDKNHVKLPIIYKNKSSMNEYGVDELFNGDTVYVQGYNDTFKITIYENNHNQYIPY